MSSKKVWIEGCSLGVLLSLLSVVLLNISDVTLLGAYTLVLLLVSASFASSQRDGALFGLFAVVGETVMDFVYFVLGAGVQVLLVPYAVGFILFVSRIPVFPLVGAIGGYLGQRYFAEKTKARMRSPARVSVGRKAKVKEGRFGGKKGERGD